MVRVAHARRLIEENDDLAASERAGPDCLADLDACLFLRVGRDGVFKIEDQRIRRQRARFLERAGIGARHVEYGAARPDRGMHRDFSARFRGRHLAQPLPDANPRSPFDKLRVRIYSLVLGLSKDVGREHPVRAIRSRIRPRRPGGGAFCAATA